MILVWSCQVWDCQVEEVEEEKGSQFQDEGV